MPKRTPPFNYEALNQARKAGEAEDKATRRAIDTEAKTRDIKLGIFAKQQAHQDEIEQARQKRYAERRKELGIDKPLVGEEPLFRPLLKGQHRWRLDPYNSYKTMCSLCGLSKWAVERDRLICKGTS